MPMLPDLHATTLHLMRVNAVDRFAVAVPARTVVCLLLLGAGAATARADDSFEKNVRPIFVQHCQRCHGPKKQKAGLRLDSKAGWQIGGENGPAIVPGNPDRSLLIKAIRGAEGLERMPPTGRLSPREIAALTKWVKDGAIDPRDGGPVRLGGVTLDSAKKWWAFRPVLRPAVPRNSATHPVDAFIAAKVSGRKLSLSPATDKRTLLRRATYDLTGLPPTAAEVAAFLKDESPEAFAKVVNRLLASPHYGERWGRHWLDLVRYADTAGENSDHPLPHAWRYRNWVIDAFNRDRPYDEFLREQVAGDILAAQGPPEKYAARVIATGYLALARRFDHDSDKSMHLTHEDGIDTLGKALLGLTLGCARCHDHKYDAISTRDYYALYGIFDSTRLAFPGCEAKQQPRDMVPLSPPAEWSRVVEPYQKKLAGLDGQIRAITEEQRKHARDTQAAFVAHRQPLSRGEIADGGDTTFESGPTPIPVKAGEIVLLSVTPLKNHGADTTLVEFELTEADGQGRRWNATEDLVGDLLAGNPHADKRGNKGVWWLFDLRNQPTLLPEAVRDVSGKAGLNAWRNGDTPSVIVNSSKTSISAWTTLPPQSLFVHPSHNGNVGVAWLSPITGKVTVKGRIKDAHPGGPDGVGWVLERFAVDVRKPLLAQVDAAARLQALTRARLELTRSAPRQDVAFAVVEGKPSDARMHLRGDPEKLGDVVPRRWLEVLGGMPISDKAASGRLDLARWIASAENPLTARVMVNRIWLHHFGKGLVKTPNDFGTRGLAPTHPELLDWLASEFMASGWSIKALHRTIMLSATYQQASYPRTDAAKVDANNDLYWRFDRRRLSAEELRDSLLAASGQLDLDRGPAQAHPFPPEASWGYTQHVPFSTFFETDKRSVYLVAIRNRRHPFLGLFDGADPNATTPQRQTTTVPTQALYFLNNPFFHAQAEKMAARVMATPDAERIDELFRIALQRSPTKKDHDFAVAFLDRYRNRLTDMPTSERTRVSWAALSRILLASNEFLFVE
jgi:mono/diheme cytochrome c family protein